MTDCYDLHRAKILPLVDATVAVFTWIDPKWNTLPSVKTTAPMLWPFKQCWELARNKALWTSIWALLTFLPERGFFHTAQAIREVYLVAFGSTREILAVVPLPDFKAQHTYKKGWRAGSHVFSSYILKYRLWIILQQRYAKIEQS